MTSTGTRNSAPSRCAWATARRVSSLPLTPDGKAEIVLDSGAGACLSARRLPIEHERAQPFGRTVDRGCQPCRSGADDHEVVQVARRRQRAPEALGDVARSGLRSTVPSSKNSAGSSIVLDAGRFNRVRVGIARHVQPSVRNQIAGEKILDLVRARRPLMPDQPQAVGLGSYSACHASSRSSTTGNSRSSGGSHGFVR